MGSRPLEGKQDATNDEDRNGQTGAVAKIVALLARGCQSKIAKDPRGSWDIFCKDRATQLRGLYFRSEHVD